MSWYSIIVETILMDYFHIREIRGRALQQTCEQCTMNNVSAPTLTDFSSASSNGRSNS